MPEFRQNIATKDWVIISRERAKRPNAYVNTETITKSESQPAHDSHCPFCVGNEELELELDRIPQNGTWQVRSVRNKYPALSEEARLTRSFEGVQRRISGLGRHEVIIEHSKHNMNLALVSPAEVDLVLELFYRRGWSINEDSQISQIIYFKNHGERAGASLAHPHSQIIALPVVPNHIRQQIEEARRYFDDTGQCVYCTMLEDELVRGERMIVQSDCFVAFVLYAAPFPFCTWIMPRQHTVSFLYTTAEERADLAFILQEVLYRLYRGLRNPDYNLVIHTSPARELNSDYLHWYISISPRLSQMAGFELGSGIYINATLPEDCAAFLRDVETRD